MGFSAQSQKWLGREGKASRMQIEHHRGMRLSTRPGVKNLRLGPDSALTRGRGPQLPHLENKEVGLHMRSPDQQLQPRLRTC